MTTFTLLPIRRGILIAMLLCCISSSLQAATWYVKPTGNDSNTGDSWAQAFQTLQKAIDVSTAGDEIRLAGGTYLPVKDHNGAATPSEPREATFYINKDLRIYGGYDPSGTGTRNVNTYVTTLSGDIGVANDVSDNAFTVVFFNQAPNTAVLDGLSIRYGYADGAYAFRRAGGALYMNASSPQVVNCIISDNYALGDGGGCYATANYSGSISPSFTDCTFRDNRSDEGGGAVAADVYQASGAPTFTRCSFSNNEAASGGAVSMSASLGSLSPQFEQCVFQSNTCSYLGGAVSFAAYSVYASSYTANPVFNRCEFVNNECTNGSGGAINFTSHNGSSSTPVLTNCVFRGNNSGDGGGAVRNWATVSGTLLTQIRFCTFYNNASLNTSTGGGGAINNEGYQANCNPTVSNCIFWGNTATYNPMIGLNYGQCQLSYSLLQTPSCPQGVTCGSGNIFDLDPLFTDAANGDLSLQSCSPAINTADATNAPAVDYAGAARPAQGGYDMGAFERQTPGSPVVAVCQNLTVNVGTNGSVSVAAADLNNGSSGCGNLAFSIGVATAVTYDCSHIGTPQTVSLTVTASNGTSSCQATITVRDQLVPLVSNCPGNLTVQTGPGSTSCDQMASWTEPTATDNCGGVPVRNRSHAPGSLFVVGSTAVSYTFSDTYNNTSLPCSFNVVVQDNTPPVVSNCPGNVTVQTGPGRTTCDQTVAWTEPSATDNCATPSLNRSHAPGSLFAVGSTAVSYVYSDAAGNSATCSFTVVVQDNTPPTLSCPNNLTVSTNTGLCSRSMIIGGSVLDDNCAGASWRISVSGASTISVNNIPAGIASSSLIMNKGTSTVTLNATDAAGNVATSCSFSVTVNDNEAPTLLCPQNVTIGTDAGQCSGSYTIADPVSDNCTGASWSYASTGASPRSAGNIPDGSSSGNLSWVKGTSSVTLSATDAAGNSANSCTFSITVNDTEAPALSCPQPVTIGTNAGVCSSSYTIADPVSDNCTGASWGYSSTGASPRSAGNISDGSSSGSLSWAKGTSSVTLSATDAAGNSATTCTFSITVNDNEAPVLSCPQDVTISTSANVCFGSYSIVNPLTDNCPGASWDYSSTGATSNWANLIPAGSSAWHVSWNKGTSNVMLTATDAAGNPASCSFNITVIDDQPPALSCPSNLTVNTDPGVCTAYVSIADPVSDNCPDATWAYSITGSTSLSEGAIPDGRHSPVILNKGAHTISLSATDAAGNSASACSYSVLVRDGEQPVVANCPASSTISTSGGQCTADYSLADPTNDNCPGGTWFMLVSGATSFNSSAIPKGALSPPLQLNIGVNSFELGATDAAANTSNPCTYSVTVIAPEIEMTGNGQPISNGDMTPSLSDHSDFGQTNNLNPVDRTFTITNDGTAPLFISNISIGGLHGTEFSAGILSPAGPILPNGSASFTVSFHPAVVGIREATVVVANDDCDENLYEFAIQAEFTCIATALSACPQNAVVVNTSPDLCTGIASYTVTATGTPSPVLSYEFSGQTSGSGAGTGSGAVFNKGITTVKVTATNPCRTEVCEFNVVVEDHQPPAIVCPNNITVNAAQGQCSATVSYNAPQGTDNCPGATTAQSDATGLSSGSSFPIGSTLQRYTVTDAAGLSANCSFYVVVVDNQNPAINCPANLTVCSDPTTNNWSGAGLAPLSLGDNCGTPALQHRLNSQNFQPGDANGRSFAVGTTTVTYRATDAAGLTATCSFSVTVRRSPRAYMSQSAVTICAGSSINLASYARDQHGVAKRYEFYKGDANGANLVFQGAVTASNGNVNFGQNRVVMPAGHATAPVVHYYYILGINSFNNGPSCSSNLGGPLVVTVNPVPALTANVSPAGQICPGNAVNISFNSSIPATVHWSNSNTGIGLAANGSGNISFNAAAPGAATIFAQASAGMCGSAPVQLPLTVSSCGGSNRMIASGAEPIELNLAPQLFPNPTNGQLFLRLPSSDAPVLYATRIEFFDAAGRRVWSDSFELAGGAERRLDLSRLAAGVYAWTLRVGDAGYNGRVVKQ